ncbi:MAG: GAF domain-containing protein [Armatimonadetes bacterium]|nr:GAF domain-containing protein [Armatimonadota bacterium]
MAGDATSRLTLYLSPGAHVALPAETLGDLRQVALAPGEQPPVSNGAGVWLVGAGQFGGDAAGVSQALEALDVSDHFAIVLAANAEQTLLTRAADERVFAFLDPSAPQHLQAKVLRSALNSVRITAQHEDLAGGLQSRDRQLRELNQIGVALSAERNVDSLLAMILSKAREITCADAGSLYLLEPGAPGEFHLRFKLSQNDSFDLNYTEFTMPLDTQSLAGYTGTTGEVLRLEDVYHLPADVPYSFSRSWDEEHGYRTRSMLVVPMANNKGEVRGVLQLINRKPAREVKLAQPADFEEQVIGFDLLSEQLVGSLASQAAVALENQILLRNISGIFEGVLMSWVKAVEDRDPATAGHSHRVTTLTLALARQVNRTTTGPYADAHFTQQQLEELRYAGLLHDIGKIYVRAEVFLKAKKLYGHHLKLIEERFDFVRRTLEAEYNRRKLDLMLVHPGMDMSQRFSEIDTAHRRELDVLNDYFDTILTANEPSVLAEGGFDRLAEVSARTYEDIYGNNRKLLSPEELQLLSIRRGNLDEEERREIESHVEWSYRILSRIPWSPELQNIPFIAWAHHEKLDGSGYPQGLRSEQIPLGAKMMTIADIYDALTAADRPYKKAQSIESALRILEYERNDGHIDSDLFAMFVDNQIYRLAHVQGAEQLADRLVYEDVT